MSLKTRVIIPRNAIQKRIGELASQIVHEYEGKHPILIGILDGTFIFLADLSRALWDKGLKDFQTSFIGISSYEASTRSSKHPNLTKDIAVNIAKRNVLLVEDIVDTGYTLAYVQKLLQARNPQSLKTIVLLSKPSRREAHVPIDYIGFEVPDKWVEGYGLDTNLAGRGNPDIIEKNR